jgi:type IV pilus assembly protein PilA
MKHCKKEAAFTLIELLIIVAIVGILTTVAIPIFASYRAKAFDAQALSDLKNAVNAEEVYFVDTLQYVSCATEAACRAVLPGMPSLTNGVSIRFDATNGDDPFFTGCAISAKGSDIPASWHSKNGGIQPRSLPVPDYCSSF